MVKLREIVLFLDAYLETASVKDDSWNGLQVDASGPGSGISKIMFAVDAGMETFERAAQEGADMIVVGRPIRDAPDPVKAARRVVAELAADG